MVRIPLATYRLQLHAGFTLRDAAALVDYLHALGVGDLYLSPLLAARPGSTHGYDVVDHSRLNPELGTEDDLALLAERLRERGMGMILDVVPNHMCIAGAWNPWWNDVIENGPGSPFAQRFDIDWRPPKPDLEAKVLLPVLGDLFGHVLEAGEIRVEHQDGSFFVRYYDLRIPAAPRSLALILEPVRDALLASSSAGDPRVLELESILTAVGHLPLRTETNSERVRERQREKDVVKRRLSALCAGHPEVGAALARVVAELNGRRGEPATFDRLEEFLEDQGFRLAFWRVAADEINYRRFFDVNELAAIRIEIPEVFHAVHELPLRLVAGGAVTGLRIDHVDGLLDPAGYLTDLAHASAGAAGGPTPYLIVEKILGTAEPLPDTWPVHGTTGYELLNVIGGVLVEPGGAARLEAIFAGVVGATRSFADVAYESKRLILEAAMSSELTVLARRLDRLSERLRAARDFTLRSLHAALVEVIACFPVYRTYVRAESIAVDPADRRAIETAVREAKSRNPATSTSIFDFVRSVLLLEDPPGLGPDERLERREFVLRFQQLTSPVMAKGIEDTAFYRHFPLAAANEVGGDPTRASVTPAELHDFNQRRRRTMPHGLSATSTHDTKRSEDVRARLAVLSEVPIEWEVAVARWRELNLPLRVAGAPAPNEEYLIYQTLVGAWPAGGLTAAPDFPERIQRHVLKALREAKVNTSWVSPNEAHELAVHRFIAGALDSARNPGFLDDLGRFVERIERPGYWNALTQTVLKVASPGVPDFYQGSELWDLSLTDPDNRRPVDFGARRATLTALQEGMDLDACALAERIARSPEDGLVKQFVTARALAARRSRSDVLERGDYLPLLVEGLRANHVVAFARCLGDHALVVAVGRYFASLARSGPPVGPAVWGSTGIVLPEGLRGRCGHEVLTGASLRATSEPALRVGDIFARLPVAIIDLGEVPSRLSCPQAP